jgi:hypothetical protein
MSKPELLVLVLALVGVVAFVFLHIVNDLPDDFLKRKDK